MTKIRILILSLLAFLTIGSRLPIPDSLRAATWTVARDGSGQYSVIQDAVGAAADGDTILIGPGTYPEHRPYTPPDLRWTEEAYVVTDGKDLTLIGAGAGRTVIGAEDDGEWTSLGPKGIVTVTDHSLVLEGVTVRYLRDGMYCSGLSFAIRDCSFENNDNAVVTWATAGTMIEDCVFADCGGGVRVFRLRMGSLFVLVRSREQAGTISA